MVDESDTVDNISHELRTVARSPLVTAPLVLLILAVLTASLHCHHAVEVGCPSRVQIFRGLEYLLAVDGSSLLIVRVGTSIHHAEPWLVAPLVRLLVRLQLISQVDHALGDANAQPRPQHQEENDLDD